MVSIYTKLWWHIITEQIMIINKKERKVKDPKLTTNGVGHILAHT